MYNPASMTILQQTFRPVAQNSEQWLRTRFVSDDGDLFLPVSICLDSSEGREEIIENVVEVLRAYGFNKFGWMWQAPGSFFLHIEVRFGSGDREAARKSKKELNADLLTDKPPKHPARRRAVKKLKQSLWRRAGKKLKAAVVVGILFVGSAIGGALKDEMKGAIEKWLEQEGPSIVQGLDTVVAKELPPTVAANFHKAVKEYIETSNDKSRLEPPPPK